MKNLVKSALLFGVASIPGILFAQTPPPPPAEDKPAKWDVAAPTGLTVRPISIETDEGSWMNLDVSPDGGMLAFDLLGDIYTLPASGGTPTRIAEGLPFETQPRFSPDGRRIAFTSDRGGGRIMHRWTPRQPPYRRAGSFRRVPRRLHHLLE